MSPTLRLTFAIMLLAIGVGVACGAKPDLSRRDAVIDRLYDSDSLLVRRMRVELHPSSPDSGITTGYFFAYGYYIPPPYCVEVEAATVTVNGIRVWPELELAAAEPREAPQPSASKIEFYRGNHIVDSLCLSVGFGYWVDIERGLTPTQAQQRAESLLLACPLVESVYARGGAGFAVKPKPGMLDGELRMRNRRLIQFADVAPQKYRPQPPKNTPSTESAGARASRVIAGVIQSILQSGGCEERSWGGSSSHRPQYARDLANLMLQTELTDRQLWNELHRIMSYSAPAAYVANRRASYEGWLQLRRRLSGSTQKK